MNCPVSGPVSLQRAVWGQDTGCFSFFVVFRHRFGECRYEMSPGGQDVSSISLNTGSAGGYSVHASDMPRPAVCPGFIQKIDRTEVSVSCILSY